VTHGKPLRAEEVIAQRVKDLRKARGWTAARLGEELAARTDLQWDRNIVTNLENGRRRIVTISELLALAFVLDVAPVHLFVPLEDDQPYAVTQDLVLPASLVRRWVRGWPHSMGLPGMDQRRYLGQIPASEDSVEYITKDEFEKVRHILEAPDEAADGPR
jgi:transcriptional regulator with XRE-family HTH domain